MSSSKRLWCYDWLVTVLIMLLLCLSQSALAAPASLEMFAASMATISNGATTAPQTSTVRLNNNNPNDDVNVAFSPAITATISFSNQQYSNITSAPGGNAMMFGADSGSSNNFVGLPVWAPLNKFGNAGNSVFTATPTTASGRGISVTNNYGSQILIATEGLQKAGKATNGRHLMGTMTITYNVPVTKPVLHLSGLGGTSPSGLGFSSEFDLKTPGLSLAELSGSGELSVSSTSIRNAAQRISGTTGSGAASGSVVVNGGPVTSLTFDVYMRGDGNGGSCSFLIFCSSTYWDDNNLQSADGFVLSPVSADAAIDLSMSKMQRVSASDSFTSSAINVPLSSTLQYQLTITNNSVLTANNASYQDSLPVELINPKVISTSNTSLCPLPSFSGNTLNGLFSGGQNASCTIIIEATANANADISNTATVSPPSGLFDSVNTNNSSTVSARLGSGSPATDVRISKSDGLDQVAAGATTIYTLRVRNDGANPVTGVILKDPVATGLTKTGTIACTTASGNACSTVPTINQLESGYALPTIAGNGGFYEITVPVVVNASAGASVTNSASVDVGAKYVNSGTSCTSNNGYIRTFANNVCTSTDTDTVLSSSAMNFDSNILEADLKISPNIPTIWRGSGGQQIITITNNGPNTANNAFATYTETPTAGVTINSVTLANGTACSLTGTAPNRVFRCPLGTLANGSSVNFLVNYTTTTAANLGNLQTQGVVRAGSDELNPGSGVGESAYRIWGAEGQNTSNPPQYSAFMVGFNKTVDTKVGSSNNELYGPGSSEGSVMTRAWPANQASPTGGYLKTSEYGSGNSTYFASQTNAPATIQRLITNMQPISASLPNAFDSYADNRRAWELRTGILVPIGTTAPTVSACIGTSSLYLDDSAYITLNGTVLSPTRDTYNPSMYVVPLTLQAGYNVISYRIANRNGASKDAYEDSAGGFSTIGLTVGPDCSPSSLQTQANIGENARINIIDAAALKITKSNSTDWVNADGLATYTLTVENQGPSDVTGAILKDPVAINMTKSSPICSTQTDNQCTTATTPTIAQLEGTGYALPTLTSGQKYILNIPVTYAATNVATVSNSASIQTPSGVTALGTSCVDDPANNIKRTFANSTCSMTDTDQVRPRIQLKKMSNSNTGTFTFNVSNNSTSNDSITTVTPGVAVMSQMIHHVDDPTQSTIITEMPATGFILTAASCTDNNASISGNPTTAIGSLSTSTSTLSIDPSYLKPGANLVCSFTNSLKQITISGRVVDDNSGTTGVNTNAYNSIQDAGEAGIAGSKVQLKDSTGTVIAEVLTNATGDYTFYIAPEKLTSTFTIVETNATGYTSVSGSTAGSYNLATDTITLSKTTADNYPNNNFGDARLSLVITPNNQQTTTAGGVVDYPHKVSGLAVITLTAINSVANQQPANTNDQKWQSIIYLDTNCNGSVDVGETIWTGSKTITPTQSICVVNRVNVPINASGGAQHLVSLQASGTATSANTAVSSNTVTDTTLIGSAGLDMKKAVRVVASCPSTASDTNAFVSSNQARNGNFLEYEITYRNNSTKNLVDVAVKDSVPTGMVFKSQTCSTTPSGMTCTPTQSGNSLVWSMTGRLLPASSGTVRYCVAVP